MQAAQREELRRLVDQARRAQVRGEAIGRCARCGIPWFLRTRGCPACSDRHWKRRRLCVNGHLVIAPRCTGCGCAWEEFTVGCGPCRTRRWRRRQRAAKARSASAARVPGTSA